MVEIVMKHKFYCDEDRFWKVFFDKALTIEVFKVMEFPEFRLLELTETETGYFRKLKAIPKIDAPAPVAKLLGPSFGYTENGEFDNATKVFSFKITPNAMADKIKTEGTVRCEPLEDGTCRRVVEMTNEVKLFAVGSAMESSFEKVIRKSWGKAAEFYNDYLKQNP